MIFLKQRILSYSFTCYRYLQIWHTCAYRWNTITIIDNIKRYI